MAIGEALLFGRHIFGAEQDIPQRPLAERVNRSVDAKVFECAVRAAHGDAIPSGCRQQDFGADTDSRVRRHRFAGISFESHVTHRFRVFGAIRPTVFVEHIFSREFDI